jgi:hypothetical protein
MHIAEERVAREIDVRLRPHGDGKQGQGVGDWGHLGYISSASRSETAR